MKLEQSFDVAAPIDRVWSTLVDIERVAPCLPGAAVTGRNDDGSYNGTFRVKVGPTSASYSGKLEMDDLQQDGHTATMHAAGSDKRGQGGAKATIKSKLTALDEETTRVEVDTDYHITGRLARFGRAGMIEDISGRLLRDFADCLQTSLAAAPDLSTAAGSSGGAAKVAAGDGDGAAGAGNGSAPAEAGAEAGGGAGEAGAGAGEAGEAGEADAGAGEAGAGEAGAGEAGAGEAGAGAGAGQAGAGAGAGAGEAGAGEAGAGEAGAGAGAGAPVQSPEPLDGLSLVGSVLWGRAKSNPAPFAFVVGLLVALLAFKRARR